MNTNTWYMARNDCLKSDSDLLSITDENEQDFVAKHLLAESFMWIGYNDLEREGAWAWSDRSDINFHLYFSSNKIDSCRNSTTFFNLPNVLRRYIRLDFVSVTKSEITVEFKYRAMLLGSLHSETILYAQWFE